MLWILVGYLVAVRTHSRRPTVAAPATATALATGRGLSRVYLGHHWLTDVLVGWTLGAAWLTVIITSHRLALAVRRGTRGTEPSGVDVGARSSPCVPSRPRARVPGRGPGGGAAYSASGEHSMSKEAALRAMREAKYAKRSARPDAGARPARAAVRAAAPATNAAPVTNAAPAPGDPEVDAAPDELCGHRSMNGRTCTREQGHAAKSHRYS